MTSFARLASSDETRARLIAALDLFTRRDLTTREPGDSETVAQLGVGATNLDRYIRPWINQTFRDPLGLPRLMQSDVKVTLTFASLLSLCKAS